MEGNFNYSISGNFSRTKNEVVDLPRVTVGSHITKPGHPVGSHYGHIAEGIVQSSDFDGEGNYLHAIPTEGEPSEGDLKFKDLNLDGTITDDDRTIIGKTLPDFVYSLNVELFYKILDFSLYIYGMDNYQIHNTQRVSIEAFEIQDLDHNKSADWAANYYREDRPSSEYLRADVTNSNNNTRKSTWWIEDGSFLRIQDAQLGITFSRNILNYLGIESARVYGSIKNLYTFTQYSGRDPEAPISGDSVTSNGVDGSSYPLPRQFTVGINLNF